MRNKMILCGQGLKKTSICAAFLAMRAGYAIRRINLIWPNLCIIFRMNIGKYGVKFTTVYMKKKPLLKTIHDKYVPAKYFKIRNRVNERNGLNTSHVSHMHTSDVMEF